MTQRSTAWPGPALPCLRKASWYIYWWLLAARGLSRGCWYSELALKLDHAWSVSLALCRCPDSGGPGSTGSWTSSRSIGRMRHTVASPSWSRRSDHCEERTPLASHSTYASEYYAIWGPICRGQSSGLRLIWYQLGCVSRKDLSHPPSFSLQDVHARLWYAWPPWNAHLRMGSWCHKAWWSAGTHGPGCGRH